MSSSTLSRRAFLASSSALALTALSASRVHGAAEKLRLACVGVGGKGWSDLTSVAASPAVQVVALCDIDESKEHMGRAALKFPEAKRFTDYRKLLDEPGTFDALIVATPDHMHAPIGLPAMQLGKHLYCEKPLTHTVHEARQMRLAAARYRVVTQMGNQIQSHSAYRTAVKLVRDGAIGKVKAVHSWQAGKHIWRLVDDRPAGADPIPETVHWDSWLGVAPVRPFKKNVYHSFNWRAWQDFSNGQLGDFGCHILDPVFQALALTAPLSIEASAPKMNREVWPLSATVRYSFPHTEYTAGKGNLLLTWYDGEGRLPPRADLGLPEGEKLPGSGSVLVGEKGTLLIPHVAMPRLFRAGKASTEKYESVPGVDHYIQWADACRGSGTTTSAFDYSGPLTETVLLGTIAFRVVHAAGPISWDAATMRLGSETAHALLRKTYRKGWEPTWIG